MKKVCPKLGKDLEYDGFKVDSWNKACIVFSDWMSDIEFIPNEKVGNDMKIRYNALAYVIDKIKRGNHRALRD